METRPKFSFTPGFGATFLLIVAAIAAVVFGGTLALSRLGQQQLDDAVTRRGRSLARQFAAQLHEHLERGDTASIHSLSDDILKEEDLRYVLLTDQYGKLLLSNSRLRWRTLNVPDELRASVCRTAEATVHPRRIDNEELYDIAVPLLSFSETTQDDPPLASPETVCLGTLHLGVSQQALVEYQRSARFLVWGPTCFILFSAVFGYMLLRSTLIDPLLTMSSALRKMPADECRHILKSVPAHGEMRHLKTVLLHRTHTLNQEITRIQRGRNHLHLQSTTLLDKNSQHIEAFKQQNMALYKLSEQASQDMQSFSSLSESAQHAVELSVTTIESTGDMKIAVGSTMHSIEEIRGQVSTNTERIVELGEKIAQIGNVVKIINTIAAQTKLIAFNAGIEAAGAGEAGGRFSIVATEVRRLANTVVESVEEIKESVSSIQTATSELILSSETGIRKANEGVRLIAESRETLQRMSDLQEEHSVSLNGVLNSLGLQENRQRVLVNGLKDLSLRFENTVEDVTRGRELLNELDAMVEELEVE